jgi:hypothetical protein
MSRYIKKAKKVLAPGEVATSSEVGDFSDVTATSVTTGYVESNNTRIRVNEDDKFTRQEGEKWVVIDYCDVWEASVSDVTWTGQNFSQFEEIKLRWSQNFTCDAYNQGCFQFGNASVSSSTCSYCMTCSQWNTYSMTTCPGMNCGVHYNSSCNHQSNCNAVFEATIMPTHAGTSCLIGGNYRKIGMYKGSSQSRDVQAHTFHHQSIIWGEFNSLRLKPDANCRVGNFGCYELLGKIKNTGVTCYED